MPARSLRGGSKAGSNLYRLPQPADADRVSRRHGLPFAISGAGARPIDAYFEPAKEGRQNVAMIFDAGLDGVQGQGRRFLARKECVLISTEIRIQVLQLGRPLR